MSSITLLKTHTGPKKNAWNRNLFFQLWDDNIHRIHVWYICIYLHLVDFYNKLHTSAQRRSLKFIPQKSLDSVEFIEGNLTVILGTVS